MQAPGALSQASATRFRYRLSLIWLALLVEALQTIESMASACLSSRLLMQFLVNLHRRVLLRGLTSQKGESKCGTGKLPRHMTLSFS